MNNLEREKERLEQELFSFDFRKNNSQVESQYNKVKKEIAEQNREPTKPELLVGLFQYTSMLFGGAFIIASILCIFAYAGSFVLETAYDSIKTEQTATTPSKYLNTDGTMNAEAVIQDIKEKDAKKQAEDKQQAIERAFKAGVAAQQPFNPNPQTDQNAKGLMDLIFATGKTVNENLTNSNKEIQSLNK